jgi:hypothetical protein
MSTTTPLPLAGKSGTVVAATAEAAIEAAAKEFGQDPAVPLAQFLALREGGLDSIGVGASPAPGTHDAETHWLAGAPGFEPGNDGIKIHLFCRWPRCGLHRRNDPN